MYLTPGSSRRAGRAQVPGSGPAGTRRPGAQHGASRAASGAQFLLPVVTPGPLGAADTDCPPRAAQARPLKRRAAWLDFRSPFPVDAAAGKEKRVDSETGVSAGPGPSGPGEGPSPRGPSATRGAGWAASLAVRFLTFSRGWAGRAHAGKLVCPLPGRLPRRVPRSGSPRSPPCSMDPGPAAPSIPSSGAPLLWGSPPLPPVRPFLRGRPLPARAHPLLTRPRPPHCLIRLFDHRACLVS